MVVEVVAESAEVPAGLVVMGYDVTVSPSCTLFLFWFSFLCLLPRGVGARSECWYPSRWSTVTPLLQQPD